MPGLFVGCAFAEGGLCGGEAGDGDAVGGAGHVVEAKVVAEGDALRLAAMLAADAQLDVRAHLLGLGDSDLQNKSTSISQSHEALSFQSFDLHT